MSNLDTFAPKLKTFDAFPKVSSTYSIRSSRGGAVTILLIITCLFLTWVQLAQYIGGTEEQQFSVDKQISRDMQINIDLTLAMPCDGITVHALDQTNDLLMAAELLQFETTDFATKDHHSLSDHNVAFDSFHDVFKRARRSKFRKHKQASKGTACRIYGSIPVTRVQGDLHFIPRGYAYFDPKPALSEEQLNMSHIVDEFSFGSYYPRLVNPLDGIASLNDDHLATYQYFMSVVPTTYISSTTGHVVETNQYSVNEQVGTLNQQVGQPPGLFFKYDMEPIRLTITDSRMPFFQWLVRFVNIMGGLVVCTGWLYKLYESAISRLMGRNDKRTMLDKGMEQEK